MVAIKDMQMPENCAYCDLFGGVLCNITYSCNDFPYETKLDDCPLVEVEVKE